MAKKSQEMVDGCFARASMDEPLFVLRATDRTAPGLVRQWAKQFKAYHDKAGTQGRDLAKAIVKHTEALEIADAMEVWPDRKQPD